MNNISKLSILVLILFLVSIQQTAGQDSLVTLGDSWIKLKAHFQRRSDIAINLVSIISKSKKADEELIEKVKSTATDLSLFIDSSKNLDSLTVQTTYQKNNSLIQSLSKALVMFENEPKLKSKGEFRNLQMHLEGIENRIAIAKRNYNRACIEYKRQDLIYGSSQKEKSVPVSF